MVETRWNHGAPDTGSQHVWRLPSKVPDAVIRALLLAAAALLEIKDQLDARTGLCKELSGRLKLGPQTMD
jgi:hypothetical protein